MRPTGLNIVEIRPFVYRRETMKKKEGKEREKEKKGKGKKTVKCVCVCVCMCVCVCICVQAKFLLNNHYFDLEIGLPAKASIIS